MSAIELFGIAAGAIGVISVGWAAVVSVWRRAKITRKYFVVGRTKASKIEPQKVLGLRGRQEYGYNTYYYPREEEHEIQSKILAGKHTLVIGEPLAGKTRMVYQSLLSYGSAYDIIIPRAVDVDPSEFRVPIRVRWWRKELVLLDDIDNFSRKENFKYVREVFLKRRAILVATCRAGPEQRNLEGLLEKELSLFGRPILLPKISTATADQIAKDAGTTVPKWFDGNVGSLFLPLDAMRQRYRDCSAEEIAILEGLRALYLAGVFSGKDEFSRSTLVEACQGLSGLSKKAFEWAGLLKSLESQGFIEVTDDTIRCEEAYLQFVVDSSLTQLQAIQRLTTVFAHNPDVLINIGNAALEAARHGIDIRAFCTSAVAAFNEALKVYTLKDFPIQYGMTQNNLGNAYRTLGEVEDKAANCKKAIAAYEKALKVYTLEDLPIQHGMTQNNLGITYRTLGEVEDKAVNCRKAIAAYEEALKVYTLEDFPDQHLRVTSNLSQLQALHTDQ